MMPTRKIVSTIAIVVGVGVGAIAVHASTDAKATAPQVVQKGQPVTLQLTSADATHGFMIRALKIDTEIKPGKVTEMTVTPDTAGNFTAICDHYCGTGHGMMKLKVEVEP
jgi:cytochrome c oxidase subunit II